MSEYVVVEATGQARVEGEAMITVYAGGVYPMLMPPLDAVMWSWPLPQPSAFLERTEDG